MRKSPIGFIGLGDMGGPMVLRLLDAGYELAIYDTRDEAMTTAAEKGAHRATDPADVACGQVLVATNGYTEKGTSKDLYRRFVPVAAAMIATSELSPNLMTHLMPKARVYGDTLRVHHYYQPSPDNKRLLFGGRLAGSSNSRGDRQQFILYWRRNRPRPDYEVG